MYLINAAFKVTAYTFLAWCSVSLVDVVGIVVLEFFKGKTHYRVRGSLPPLHTILLLK